MSESSAGVVRRYLESAIAGERNFQSQLESSAAAKAFPAATRELFRESAAVVKQHHEQLSNRLQVRSGGGSLSRSFLSHLFSSSPKQSVSAAANDQGAAQDLVSAFTLGHSQLALFEVVAVAADAASDPDTAALTRSILEEDRRIAQKIWRALGSAFRLGQ